VDFPDALRAVKHGKRVRRAVWHPGEGHAGNGFLLLAHVTADDGRECMPQLLVTDASDGILRPFSGANWDLLAEDWELAE
jgi:hypothetical protein